MKHAKGMEARALRKIVNDMENETEFMVDIEDYITGKRSGTPELRSAAQKFKVLLHKSLQFSGHEKLRTSGAVVEPPSPQTRVLRVEDLGSYCTLCGRAPRVVAETLKACSKCRSTLYCSQTCLKQDWPEHKRTCAGTVKP